MALLLVVAETTLVTPPIPVDEQADSMHLIILKVALIVASVRPSILTMPLHLVVAEEALVAGLVEHDELAVTMAEAILILAFEVAVMPRLPPLAVLLIVLPRALV